MHNGCDGVLSRRMTGSILGNRVVRKEDPKFLTAGGTYLADLDDPRLEGAVYVFRNRAGTALKLLLYDGQGDWLCMKR